MKTFLQKLLYLFLLLSIISSCNQSLDDNNYVEYDRGERVEFASSINVGGRHIEIAEKNVDQVTEGLKYIKLQLKDERHPLVVHAIQMDRNQKDLTVQLLSGKKNVKGREKVSAMVANNSTATQEVLSAINADFFEFEAATPLGGQVVDNKVEKLVSKSWNTSFFTDEFGIPHVAKIRTIGIVSSPKNGNPITITDYNTARSTDFLVLYDAGFTKNNTGTNEYGAEALLSPVGFEWGSVPSNQLEGLKFKVEKITKMEVGGSMEIPAGKVVLSAHGKSYTWLSNLNEGDDVTLDLSLQSESNLGQNLEPSNLCGAHQIIMKNSLKATLTGTDDLVKGRHPRSAVGYSPDRKKVTMVVVEGRSDVSLGVNLAELADICTYFNMTDAVNLDGGGSSTIVGKGKVLNVLTDGEERAVVNAIAFVRNKK